MTPELFANEVAGTTRTFERNPSIVEVREVFIPSKVRTPESEIISELRGLVSGNLYVHDFLIRCDKFVKGTRLSGKWLDWLDLQAHSIRGDVTT